MSKFVYAAVITAFAFTATVPAASAAAAPPPVVPVTTASTAGAWATGGFLGVVAALDIYDFVRRTTCSGDFLGLGGPGFGEPLKVGMNVMTPQCPVVVKAKRKKH
jgi:hypothetical protein